MSDNNPLVKRSAAKAAALKAAGGLVLLTGIVLALFGLTILRALIFDLVERPETIQPGRWWFAGVCLALALIGIGLSEWGWRLLRRGRKFAATSAQETLARDPRPPVVYIRSFRDDDVLLTGHDRRDLWFSRFFLPVFSVRSKEEVLARCLAEIGPVVAIGNPREELPELGAARMYFSDAEWQSRILEFMDRSALVVLLGGPTKNLWWEIGQALERLPPEKLVCLVLDGSENQAFERDLEKRLNRPGSLSGDGPYPRRGIFGGRAVYGKLIHFGPGWNPVVSVIRGLPGRMAFYNSSVNQFEPALRVALRPVFARLERPGPRLVLRWGMVAAVAVAVAFVLIFLAIVLTRR